MDYLKRAYMPYYEEMLHCLLFDLPVLLISFFILWYIKLPIGMIFGIILGLTSFFVLLNYRISILSVFEKRFGLYESTDIYFIKMCEEGSASGHHFNSVMPSLYPKKMRVCRYKVICQNTSKSKIKLRCVMSAKKAQILRDQMAAQKELQGKLMYGKWTHIIIKYENKDDWAKMMNAKF